MIQLKRRLSENWKRVEQRIHDACGRAGRDPKNVTLVAVTKYASIDIIRLLVEMGVVHVGESRPQELAQRAAMIKEWLARRSRTPQPGGPPRPHWHLVGHLQRNKVKSVLPWTSLIHSVDSLRLAEEIDSRSAALGRKTPVLLQTNASGEASKHGVAVAAVTHLAEQLQSLEHIEIRGLMSIAPLTANEGLIRHTFERVRELFDEIIREKTCGADFRELSLGMSSDFEFAIEYGATYVRIGSALLEGIEHVAQTPQLDEQPAS